MMPSRDSVEKNIFHSVIDELVFLAQGEIRIINPEAYQIFQPLKTLKYYPICDDFGPMNLASTTRFIEMLEDEIYDYPSSKIIVFVDSGRRALANAVYLLGAFMILRLNSSACETSKRFDWLDQSLVEPFRDATFSKADFALTLMDCWQALERGRSLGWVRYPSEDAPELWGMINIDRCAPYRSAAPRAYSRPS
jgi:cell division cycle 14